MIENNAISSDDEEVINKLRAKLVKLENLQSEMKRINSQFRKGGFDAITELSNAVKEKLKADMKLSPWEKSVFPTWRLSNNNAEIRRVKQRILELEKLQQEPVKEAIQGKGYTITENKEDNRIWIQFDEKPCDKICQIMCQHGFKWSPSRVAWVRMLNQSGRYQAQAVIKAIESIMS